MSTVPHSAQQLQRWLQAVITHAGGVAAGIESTAAREAISSAGTLEAIILPSRSQSSLERLAVYGNAYYVRLLDCLRELFPACRYAVGDEVFDEFAYGYLQSYPPQSYTLGDLANNFATFLDETRREQLGDELDASRDDVQNAQPEEWSRFVVELARFEYVLDQVFDGLGTENDPPQLYEQLLAVPQDVWPSIQLRTAPCFRLLEFEFPVNDYYGAFRRSESPDLPALGRSYVAVTRRDYIVRRFGLDVTQYRLLKAIMSGSTIGDAVARAASLTEDHDKLPDRLSRWFSIWGREQFFARIEYARKT
jgi:Putative DNA-binding domain